MIYFTDKTELGRAEAEAGIYTADEKFICPDPIA